MKPHKLRRLMNWLVPLAISATLISPLSIHAQTAAPESILVAQAAAAQSVVITATRAPLPQADAPAATSVVTQEALQDHGSDNLLDGLRGETGVSVIGRPLGGRRVLSLRGMESRHSLMLVNGQRIAASDGVIGNSDFQVDWLAIPEIERIEVVRGPMSVLYGSEALGGVVNIITRRPGDTLAGTARAEGLVAQGDRGGDGHRLGARMDVPLGEQWRLAVSASQIRRQSVASASDARIDELEGRNRLDGAAQLLWLPARGHELLLEHREGNEARWGGARERSGARRYHLSMHDVDRRHSALTWDADWNAALHTQLRAYAGMLDHSNTRTEGVAALRPNRVEERVLDGSAGWQLGAQTFTGGFEHRDEGLRNAAMSGGEGSVAHKAVYLQDEVKLGPVALTLGARHDHHEVYGGRSSPRIYAVWKPAEGWTLKGGAGYGFKAPTLKQVTAGYAEDEGPFTYLANPALQPEINRAVELGLGWQNPGFGVQTMIFHNRVRNLIVPVLVSSTPRPQYLYQNLDVAILKGVELSGEWRIAREVSARLNHQWLDARNDAGERLDRRPRQSFGASIDWHGAGMRGGLRIDHVRGLLLATTTVGAAPEAVPATTTASAYGAWALSKSLELGAGIDNLRTCASRMSRRFMCRPSRHERSGLRSRRAGEGRPAARRAILLSEDQSKPRTHFVMAIRPPSCDDARAGPADRPRAPRQAATTRRSWPSSNAPPNWLACARASTAWGRTAGEPVWC